MTSYELAQWQAYEKLNGPLDDTWRDEATATQVELAHDQLYLTGQAHFTDKQHRKGPIEQRDGSYARPDKVFNP